MRIITCLFVYLTTICVGFSQNGLEQQIDSLEAKLKVAKTDTSRIQLMCKLTRAYGGIDSIKVFENGFKALSLSKKNNYPYGITYSYHVLAGGYLDYFDLENAKKNYLIAQEYSESLIARDSSRKNLQLWAKVNFNLGVAYGYQGNVTKEIEYINKTVPIARRIKDTLFLAIANTNLGIKHLNFAQFDKAYECFTKSGEQYQKLNRPEDFIFDRLNFATCLYEMDSLASMKKTLDLAKSYLDKIPNSISWHQYYSSRGLYLSSVGKYNEAIQMYDLSYTLLKTNKMRGGYSGLFLKYADTYDKLGNYKMSKKYINDFLELALQSQNDIDRAKAYYRLAKFEAGAGNHDAAYDHLYNYIKLEDSLGAEQIASKIQQIESQYESEKKEKEILRLTNEMNIADLTLEKKKSQGYLLMIIVITLLFLLSLGFMVYRNKLREGRLKERKHIEEIGALKHEQQAKIFSAMIEGQEKERKRLAIDLHDGLRGRWSAISLKISKLYNDTDTLSYHPRQDLIIIQNDIKDSLSELREIARNLMPETLTKYGLKTALQDYCSNMNSNGCNVTLQFYEEEKKITPNEQVTVYRIIQELINNAVKHAKASEVLVQYIHEQEKIDIIVEDNGIGFDYNASENNKGMGLANLKTRVKYLQGIFDIQSSTKEGTTITVQLEI